MTYEEFLNFVPSKCMYETIYDDSDGRTILVIKLLDAFSMVNKAQRTWVGLTDDEVQNIVDCRRPTEVNIRKAEQLLKEKNT
jgi:hypothetical protein